jgi:hypothetical protein
MIALIAAAVAVGVASAAPPPGAAPYLSGEQAQRKSSAGAGGAQRKAASVAAAYGVVAEKRKQQHPLWESCHKARLPDSKQRPWDFFRDMDQDPSYKHENVFKSLDLDGNADLSKEEFWFAFSGTKDSPMKERRMQAMWDKDDEDMDGVISFAEFDGFKGIGDGNMLVDHSEFFSFFRRNRRVACFFACLLSELVSTQLCVS